jgi:hypothetical protein
MMKNITIALILFIVAYAIINTFLIETHAVLFAIELVIVLTLYEFYNRIKV